MVSSTVKCAEAKSSKFMVKPRDCTYLCKMQPAGGLFQQVCIVNVIYSVRPLHDRGVKEKCVKILLIEAGNAVNI